MDNNDRGGVRFYPDEFGMKSPPANCLAVLFRINAAEGCFDRRHSPAAFKAIDAYISRLRPPHGFSFEERECGIEIIAFATLRPDGITLGAGIVNLLATVIRARSHGIRKGDDPSAPLVLTMHFIDNNTEMVEERVLRVSHTDNVAPAKVRDAILYAFTKYDIPGYVLRPKNKVLPPAPVYLRARREREPGLRTTALGPRK
jgi:hypothetical protein